MVKETESNGAIDMDTGIVSIPSRGSGKGDVRISGQSIGEFDVSIPSRGSGKGDKKLLCRQLLLLVLIPSRGSGKGDGSNIIEKGELIGFQSPLGEVVKETKFLDSLKGLSNNVSIPSRGSGKGDYLDTSLGRLIINVSIPSRGSGKGDDENKDGVWGYTTSFNPLSGKW